MTFEELIKEIESGDKVYMDSETCGLHGIMVLLQWAVDQGPIHLWDVWKKPVWQTMRIIEAMLTKTVIGFNLAFDWFHICKLYNIWRLCNPDWIPENYIEAIARKEPKAHDGPCLKPAGCLDLLMYSRKGPFQSLMGRNDMRVKRVPAQLAEAVADTLEREIILDDIYFARSANPSGPRWKVYDIKKPDGTINKDFKDVVLKFNAASGLKFLAEHVLGYQPKYHFKDVEPPRHLFPKELGYAPTAWSVSSPKRKWEVYDKDGEVKGWAWPGVIRHHIEHWATREDARDYANDDIVYTRGLDEYFNHPEPNDDDSVLTCMVGAVRWKGFRVDLEAIKEMKAKAEARVAAAPIKVTRISEVKRYLSEMLDDTELSTNEDVNGLASTGKKVLEKIAKWKIGGAGEQCEKCWGDGCTRCEETGRLKPGPHPAAICAKELLDAKQAIKEVELYDKLLRAKRLHASFNVIGTLSTRMSGTDGLNPQGIKKAIEVRACFPMSWPGQQLSIGDFSSFEVTLADAVYNDETLRQDLLTGRKIHAVFGMELFPGMTYEEILASDGKNPDFYGIAKAAVFAMFYGGDTGTLARNANVSEEIAERAYLGFCKRYPGVGLAREKTMDAFCSMKQPGGIGSQVIWADPADHVESFLGFRRYFTLENQVTKVLFELANSPPKHWKECKVKVMRRDRVQAACGAVQSALFACAFGQQSRNMRAAANHEIQSPGGQITKSVQRDIWDLQPVGIHEFIVMPMNVHDELIVPAKPEYVPKVTAKVRNGIERFRPQVPLIGMDWCEDAASWADKKSGEIKMRPPSMVA